ncbi:4'-phosphopantetheinyl transferase superfamily protein [uncultured Eubacterium sp.]|uniref:4'-phosphopantetheinyl transferase superfamily protein n=1 Tax=uncultured Eubacterium sp. TaxID=165185 RepID=UPI00338E080F
MLLEKIDGPNTDIIDYFANAEQNYINSSLNKTSAFYDIWTQKEAYLKMKGTGFINISPSDFDVTQKKHLLSTKKVGTYMLSVCSESNLSSNICTKAIDLSDVLFYFDNL